LDEILDYIASNHGVKTDKIASHFALTMETIFGIIDFLIEYGFVQYEEGKVFLTKHTKRLYK